jgi:predicted peptidase
MNGTIMKTRRDFLVMTGLAATFTAAGLPVVVHAAGNIKTVTSITQVYGDGVKLIAVAVEYDEPIEVGGLSLSSFQVEGRTVTDVFPSASADPAARASAGRFVIVQLSPDDPSASLAMKNPPADGAKGPPGQGGPGKAGSVPVYDTAYHAAEAVVVQMQPVKTASGVVIPATLAKLSTTSVKNLIVDDFRQLEFKDDAHGRILKYNLFVPAGYDPGRAYPLVLFMHDAGATSDMTRSTLFQGLGAVAWASPADQAARPAFVLAPQYGEIIADDDSQTSTMLDTTIDLIKALEATYSIDPKRIYATGQSGGCMMAIAMNIKYPEFFAASFLVAGQWEPTLVKPLSHKNLWILVSQDDDKAWPVETAMTAVMEKQGANVSRAIWDGTWSPEQFHAAFGKVVAEGRKINFVALRRGTVIPEGQSAAGASGHRNTWRLAYSIPEIREWIFLQRL